MKKQTKWMLAGISTVVIGAAAATTAVVLTNRRHKDVSKTKPAIGIPDPEPKIMDNGGAVTPKSSGDTDRNGVSGIDENLLLTQSFENILSGEETMPNGLVELAKNIETIENKMNELAVKIGINSEDLKRLEPSVRDGKIYASNIGNQNDANKIYAAFNMTRNDKVESPEYKVFADAITKFHELEQSKDYLGVIEEIQKAIDKARTN